MTEAEWAACADPQLMIGFLGAIPTDRKLRLFACACCRRREDLASEPLHSRILTVAELLAEGLTTLERLRKERESLLACSYALWAATQEDSHLAALQGSQDIAIHAGQEGYSLVGQG